MANRPRAYSLSRENQSAGAMVFYDYDSGMVLPSDFTGEFVYLSSSSSAPSLMLAWLDRATGERAFKYIRTWEGA